MRHRPRNKTAHYLRRAGFCAVLAGCAYFSSQALYAQTRPAPGGSIAERYARAREAFEKQQVEEAKQKGVHDTLVQQANALKQQLVDNAARVQDLEQKLGDTEMELARLSEQETMLQDAFTRDRKRIAGLLAVLQRLESDRPPALALQPGDAVAAARGAMVLGAWLPPVYEEAAHLSKRLRQLTDTKLDLQKTRVAAAAETKELTAARETLAVLEAERQKEAESAGAELAALHQVTEEVARETGDLKSLIDRIAALRTQSGGESGMTVVTAQSTGPAALEKGSLLRPIAGSMETGDPAGPGLTPGHAVQGLWFTASGPGAQVVAPGDGEVVFAGAYQKFGQVLILEIPGGYDLLLAGLGRMNVKIGDLVLAGEPVGVLPQTRSSDAGGDENAGPRLYMELRRNGQTLNPAPWMRADLRKAKKS